MRAGAIALVVVLGLGLRLYGLDRWPFWVDEAATLGIAALPWAELRAHVFWVEANPPAYYALMHAWLALGWPREAWLRLPSALAGAAALLPFALFVGRAFGPRAGLVGLALLAVSASHLRYSQEARTYAILFLAYACALLAAQGLVADVASRARRRALVAVLAVLTAAMIWLHATGLVAGASVFVYAGTVLWARGAFAPARLVPLAAAGLLGLLLAAPCIAFFAGIVLDKGSAMSWQPPLSAADAATVMGDLFLAPYLSRAALPVAALQIAAFGLALASRRREPEFLGCLAAFAFAPLVTVAISLVEPILFERTLLFALVPWTAMLAAGIGAIRRPSLAALAGLALLVPAARSLHNEYRIDEHEEPWDAVGRHLATAARPGDTLLAVGVFEAVAAHHYLREAGGAVQVTVAPQHFEATFVPMARAMLRPRAILAEPTPAELCTALGDGAAWLVARRDAGRRVREAIAGRLREAGAEPREVLAFGQLSVSHWSAPRCG
jgi:hypothetical protein